MENQQEAAAAEEKRKSESKDEDGEEEGEADNWEDNWDAASDGSDDTPAPPEFVIDQVKGYRQRKIYSSPWIQGSWIQRTPWIQSTKGRRRSLVGT